MNEIKLGQLASPNDNRDAIHIAIATVIAGENLKPGEHIGLKIKGGIIAIKNTEHLGIVDPFLKNKVKKDQYFYMLIYPNTITYIKHIWSHPHFDSIDESVQYLKDFANEYYIDYDELILGLEHGNLILGTESYAIETYIKYELFRHFERVTGIKHSDQFIEEFYFRCSC